MSSNIIFALWLRKCSSLGILQNLDVSESTLKHKQAIWQQQWRTKIEGFTVADVILVVKQTQENLESMYGKNHDFDAR